MPIRLHAVRSLGSVGDPDPVAVRAQVDLVGAQGDRLALAVGARPGHGHGAQRVVRVGRHQHDVRLLQVKGMSLRLRREPPRIAFEDLSQGIRVTGGGLRVFLAQVVAGEDQRAAGVLLLGVAEQVRRVRDLGLDLLLAVAEVVVGDHRHDHAASVPGTDLEGAPAVVQLVLLLPAHPVAHLPVGGLAHVGQPERLLRQPGQVRGEDDAAGVAGPGLRGQGRVVLGQVGVAPTAEDALHEVEVGDHATGHDEAGLHPLLAHGAGYLWGNQRAKVQRDEACRRLRLVGRVGQDLVDLRRLERDGQQPGERHLGHGDLVIGDGEPALGDVEDPLGGPAIVGRVVQHAVDEPVAAQQRRGEAVAV